MCKIGKIMVQILKGTMLSLNEKEKNDIVRRFIEHCGVQQYLLDYVKYGKDVESNHKLLDAIKTIDRQLATIRHNQHLTYKNVLLF
jgi:hypothetical protein